MVKSLQTDFKLTANGLCMSSGTCTHFQNSTNLSVPLLIHGVRCSTFLV